MIFPPKEQIELTPQEIAEEIGYGVMVEFNNLIEKKIKEAIEKRGGSVDKANWQKLHNFEAEVNKIIRKEWLK